MPDNSTMTDSTDESMEAEFEDTAYWGDDDSDEFLASNTELSEGGSEGEEEVDVDDADEWEDMEEMEEMENLLYWLPEPTPQPQSRLLQLPGELRNAIYANVFENFTPGSCKLSPEPPQPGNKSDRLAILRTCGQIYRETRNHWPTHAVFMYESAKACVENLATWTPGIRSRIRHIKLELRDGRWPTFSDDELEVLSALSLDTVELLVPHRLHFYIDDTGHWNISPTVRVLNLVDDELKIANGVGKLSITTRVAGLPPGNPLDTENCWQGRRPSPWNRILQKRHGKNSGSHVVVREIPWYLSKYHEPDPIVRKFWGLAKADDERYENSFDHTPISWPDDPFDYWLEWNKLETTKDYWVHRDDMNTVNHAIRAETRWFQIDIHTGRDARRDG